MSGSDPERSSRQYPPHYEKIVPLALALIAILVIVVLVIIFAVILGLVPGS